MLSLKCIGWLKASYNVLHVLASRDCKITVRLVLRDVVLVSIRVVSSGDIEGLANELVFCWATRSPRRRPFATAGHSFRSNFFLSVVFSSFLFVLNVVLLYFLLFKFEVLLQWYLVVIFWVSVCRGHIIHRGSVLSCLFLFADVNKFLFRIWLTVKGLASALRNWLFNFLISCLILVLLSVVKLKKSARLN